MCVIIKIKVEPQKRKIEVLQFKNVQTLKIILLCTAHPQLSVTLSSVNFCYTTTTVIMDRKL